MDQETRDVPKGSYRDSWKFLSRHQECVKEDPRLLRREFYTILLKEDLSYDSDARADLPLNTVVIFAVCPGCCMIGFVSKPLMKECSAKGGAIYMGYYSCINCYKFHPPGSIVPEGILESKKFLGRSLDISESLEITLGEAALRFSRATEPLSRKFIVERTDAIASMADKPGMHYCTGKFTYEHGYGFRASSRVDTETVCETDISLCVKRNRTSDGIREIWYDGTDRKDPVDASRLRYYTMGYHRRKWSIQLPLREEQESGTFKEGLRLFLMGIVLRKRNKVAF